MTDPLTLMDALQSWGGGIDNCPHLSLSIKPVDGEVGYMAITFQKYMIITIFYVLSEW